MEKKHLVYGGVIGCLLLFYVLRFAGVGLGNIGGGTIPTQGAIDAAKKRVTALQVDLAELYEAERARDDKRLALVDQTAPFWQVVGDKFPTTEVQTQIERLALRSNVKLAKVGAPKTLELSEDLQAIEVNISSVTSIRDFAEFAREVENHKPMLDFHYCSMRPNRVKDPDSVMITGRIRAYVLSIGARDYLAGKAATLPSAEGTP